MNAPENLSIVPTSVYEGVRASMETRSTHADMKYFQKRALVSDSLQTMSDGETATEVE